MRTFEEIHEKTSELMKELDKIVKKKQLKRAEADWYKSKDYEILEVEYNNVLAVIHALQWCMGSSWDLIKQPLKQNK